jgi:hypothetical protein
MKNYIEVMLFTAFLCLSTSIFAQNTSVTQSTYEKEAIYMNQGFFRYSYVKNGVKMPVGFLNKKLKKEFLAYPEALKEFKKYQKKQLIGGLALLGSIIIADVLIIVQNNRTSHSIQSESITDGQIAGLTSSGVLFFSSLPIVISSENSLQKAIFSRNNALLAK